MMFQLQHFFRDSIQFPFLFQIYHITSYFFTKKKHTPSSTTLPNFQVTIPPQPSKKKKTSNQLHTTFSLPLSHPTSTPGDAKLSNPDGVAATVPKEPMPQEAVPSPRGEAEGVPGSGDTSPTERRRPVSVMEWTYRKVRFRVEVEGFVAETFLRIFFFEGSWKKGSYIGIESQERKSFLCFSFWDVEKMIRKGSGAACCYMTRLFEL